MMGVVLIGYRGSGKTTVGRLLADRLGVMLLDTDAVIVEEAGRTIAEIFSADGEAAFRRLECEAIRAATSIKNRVISVGGGAVENPDNRAALRSYGTVVWLVADSGALWRRIEGDAATGECRPNLAGGGLAEIEAVLSRRSPLYAETAHVRIEVAGLTPDEVAGRIVDSLPG